MARVKGKMKCALTNKELRGSGEDMNAVRQHLGSSLYQEAVRGIKADMVFEGGAWEFRDSGIDLLTTTQSHTFFKGL